MGCNYTYGFPSREVPNLQQFKAKAKADNGAKYDNVVGTCRFDEGRSSVGRGSTFDAILGIDEMIGSRYQFKTDLPFHTKIFGETWVAIRHDEHEGISPSQFTTEELLQINYQSSLSPFPSYPDLEEWKGITMRKQKCQLNFCAKKTSAVDISNGKATAQVISIPLDISQQECRKKDCLDNGVWPVGHSGPVLKVDTKTRVAFADTIEYFINQMVGTEMRTKSINNMTTPMFSHLLSTLVTAFISSPQNLDATKVYGEIQEHETYVLVKWMWAIFPIVLVVGSTFFLMLTILVSRKGEQLYKTSVLTGYFHKLNGWSDVDLEKLDRKTPLQRGRKDTYDRLVRKGREIKVRLARNGRGVMVFVKQP